MSRFIAGIVSFVSTHTTVARYFLLVLVVTCAYYPSLFQPARADQFVYAYTTRDKADLYSLTIGSYAWDREINGDIHFFRPVLFFLLGLERWAFSPDRFIAWQLTSLMLHLSVVLLLCHCLRLLQGSRSTLPFIIAGFFGVQYASMELIAWHHLSGYVLFCVLLVSVFCILFRDAQGRSGRSEIGLVALLLVSAFTLELGNVLAVLVGVYLLGFKLMARNWRARGASPPVDFAKASTGGLTPATPQSYSWLTVLGTIAVPVIYTSVNMADQFSRYGRFLAGPSFQGCLSGYDGFVGMVTATSLWLRGGFLPSAIDLGVDSRMSIVAIHSTPTIALALQWGLIAVALAAFLFLAIGTLRRGSMRAVWPGVVALMFGLAYAGVLVFLRAGPRGIDSALRSNSYYAYIFNLAIVIFLGSLLGARIGTAGIARLALGIALTVLSGISACRVYAQGQEQSRWGNPTLVLVDQIRHLQRSHGDGDFTFCVAPDHPGERDLPYVGKSPTDGAAVTVAQALFPHHYRRDNPCYYLWKRHRGFDVVTFEGRVLGIPWRRWPTDLSKVTSPSCIVATSVVEVERAIGERRHHGQIPHASIEGTPRP